MERLHCVRALGEEMPEMAGINKVHFIDRNNTSVRGEITEGRQYLSKIIMLQIPLLPISNPPNPSLWGLSDSSTGMSVASAWHTGMSAGSW